MTRQDGSEEAQFHQDRQDFQRSRLDEDGLASLKIVAIPPSSYILGVGALCGH